MSEKADRYIGWERLYGVTIGNALLHGSLKGRLPRRRSRAVVAGQNESRRASAYSMASRFAFSGGRATEIHLAH